MSQRFDASYLGLLHKGNTVIYVPNVPQCKEDGDDLDVSSYLNGDDDEGFF